MQSLLVPAPPACAGKRAEKRLLLYRADFPCRAV